MRSSHGDNEEKVLLGSESFRDKANKKASEECTSSYKYISYDDHTHININKHVNNKDGVLKRSDQQLAREECRLWGQHYFYYWGEDQNLLKC